LTTHHLRCLAFLLLCICTSLQTAHASAVIVPDEYPTIQQAIDSGADSVQVRAGTYPERPLVDHNLVLQGIGEGARPLIDGLDVTNENFFLSDRFLNLTRCQLTQSVSLTTVSIFNRNLDLSFSECSLDAGLNQLVYLDPDDIAKLTINNCHIGGHSSATAFEVFMDADTLDGGVSWRTHGVMIGHSWFRGGPGTAIELTDTPRRALLGNHIEHYDIGVYGENMDTYELFGNVINNCAIGMLLRNGADITVASNTISQCDIGVDIVGNDNLVLVDNTILRNRLFGMRVFGARFTAHHNVIGLSNGPGLFIDYPIRTLVYNNTLFANDGSGIEISRLEGHTVTMRNNIGAHNKAWGLSASGIGVVQLECNDWFSNDLGTTTGVETDSTNLALDPLFCDLVSGNVTLNSESPLINAPACGAIGALGVGCSVTATLLQMLEAEPEGNQMVVRWQFGAGIHPICWLERSRGAGGAWAKVGIGSVSDRDIYAATDAEVQRGITYWYRVGWLEAGRIAYSTSVSASIDFLAVRARVFPNPSPGVVNIELAIPVNSSVDVRIYDLSGRQVSSVGKSIYQAGRHTLRWDGRQPDGALAPPGWYICRLRAGGTSASQMLSLVR